MNASQRRVHAGVWTVLGALLLAMLAIAVASRPSGPGAENGVSGHAQEP